MLTLWRQTLGNWRQTMYDTQVMFPLCTYGYSETQIGPDGVATTFKVNDCGSPYGDATGIISAIYHVAFQIFSTFAVLNVVIAIILGAFTWCYAMEEGELTDGLPLTADNVRHFKAIWDRFDLYSTGRVDISKLQLLLTVIQYNIPSMFCTGDRTQSDEMLYNDYASWGFGIEYDDPDTNPEAIREKKNKEAYDNLVVRLGKFERSKEVWMQLDAAECDIQLGCNDNVAGFLTELHPLGSVTDADLHIFTKEINNEIIFVPTFDVNKDPPAIEVLQVTFSSLIKVLAMDPLGLNDHDIYVCYDYKDPFAYFQPGYFKDKITDDDGKVCLITDPLSIEPSEDNANLPGQDLPLAPNMLPDPCLSVLDGHLHIKPAVSSNCDFMVQVALQDMLEYRYTTDGSEPTCNSALYNEPLLLDDLDKNEVQARAFLIANHIQSKTVTLVPAQGDSETRTVGTR